MSDTLSAQRSWLASVATVVTCGLLGIVVVGVGGLAEAVLLSHWVDYADPLREIGRSILANAALGALLGAALGVAVQGPWLRRLGPHETCLVIGCLVGLWIALVVFVHTRDPRGPLLPQLVVLGLAPLLVAVAFEVARRVGRRSGPGRVRAGPLWAIGGALLVAGWVLPRVPPAPSTKNPSRPPNVLLLVLDTTRFDRLSLHGYAHETTPELDRIARDGAVFVRAYAAAPWTLPSHASIFTGLYPGEHGATSEHPRLDPELPTLAEGLTRQGLHSVSITKKTWLSQETGMLRGFTQVFDLYRPPRRPALVDAMTQVRRAVRGRPPDKGAAEVTQTAIGWLGRHGHAPFFLFVNYNEPHSELRPPSPFRERFLGDRVDTAWGRTRFPDTVAADLGRETYTAEDFEILSRLYDASIAYQDRHIGRLLDFLREQELLDETILLVTSDHGENLGEHGLLGHNLSISNTLLHVPLIVRYPKLVEAGLVIDEPVEIRRIGTLVDLLMSRSSGPRLAAQELVAALSGRPDGAIISEAYRPLIRRVEPEEVPDEPRYQRRRKSVILDGLKYVWSSDGDHELYDLRTDPGEERNILSERSRDVVSLQRLLESEPGLWREPAADPDLQLSEEAREQLREMGYLPRSDTDP